MDFLVSHSLTKYVFENKLSNKTTLTPFTPHKRIKKCETLQRIKSIENSRIDENYVHMN